jgi:hypothetical protein
MVMALKMFKEHLEVQKTLGTILSDFDHLQTISNICEGMTRPTIPFHVSSRCDPSGLQESPPPRSIVSPLLAI